MSPELAQWIPPAVIVGVMLYLHRANRHDIKGLRGDIADLRIHTDTQTGNLRNDMDTEIGNLRNDMHTQIGNLRERMDAGFGNLLARMGRLEERMGRLEERMARLEATLDVLRQFLVRNGRGTAA